MTKKELYKGTLQYHINELSVALCDLLCAWFPIKKVKLLRYKVKAKSVADWYKFRDGMSGR